MEQIKKEKDKSLIYELLRFALVGLICTFIDFAINLLILFLIKEGKINEVLRQIIAITLGFIGGVTANYLLSTFFVFKNIKDEKKAKTPLYIFLFVILSVIGLGLSYAIFFTFKAIFLTASINIDFEFHFSKELLSSLDFWMYVLVFIIKTAIVLVYNYLTRKFIIYNAPKKDEISKE